MSNFDKTLIFFSFLLGFSIRISAQNCSQNLEDAKRAYYNGQFSKVSTYLERCLDVLSREERAEAYKLLTDTHLVNGETERANKYLYDLLMVDPNFEPRESDLVEFKELYKSYRIKNRFSFGFVAGFQRPDFIIMKHRSNGSETIEPSDYDEKPGLILGLTASIALFHNFYINPALRFETASFEQEEIILQYQSVYSNESYGWLSLPVQLKYIQPFSKWHVFLGGGLSFQYLLFAHADLDHSPLDPPFLTPFIGIPEEAVNYDLSGQRKDWVWNGILSAGIQKQFGQVMLEIQFSYSIGFNNLVDVDNRYTDRELLDRFAYVPDDFRMNSYQLSISINKVKAVPIKK